MDRRIFLKCMAAALIGAGTSPRAFAGTLASAPVHPEVAADRYLKDYLTKMDNFDASHADDVYLDREYLPRLESSLKRLQRLQRVVGHGNFYLLNFDEAVNIARNYTRVGPFSRPELDFLELIFYEDSAHYGFMGKKPLKNLTDRIRRKAVVKIPGTGNYLYRGQPLETYRRIRQLLGPQVILTSGVRSVTKQFMLFLNKAHEHQGNLSLASRSLAPPGYSYHGVGDFDVGQVGFGAANFTARFTTTPVFKRLQDLGYINLRYEKGNLLGVRFEPWHIKVHPCT
jgi:D-alanyl-D-alanine carboxypeptidase